MILPLRLVGLVLLVVHCFVADFAPAATRVDLVIDEALPDRKVAWPVTTGVPFPRGALTDANQCRLVDDAGGEQPLQTKVAATWDAGRSSVRWLTIDFIAQPGRKYALEFGPDVARKEYPSPLKVTEGGDVVVESGALEINFSPTAAAALGAIRVDLNGDGRITAEERVASGGIYGDHQYIGRQGEWDETPEASDRSIVVESAGPVRACIRVDGWYKAPRRQRIVRYRTRYHLFAGLPIVKAIDEFRIVGSTRDVQFREIALKLTIEPQHGVRRVYVSHDTEANPVSVPWSDAAHEIALTQETFRHYGNPECRAVLTQQDLSLEKAGPGLNQFKAVTTSKTHFTAERAGAWMQVVDERSAVTGSLRNFSQQFPKGWEVRGNPDEFTLYLWSPRVEPLDFGEAGLRRFLGPAGTKYLLDWQTGHGSTPITDFFYYAGRHALNRDGADGRGINKHHEIWYHFGPPSQAAAGREYGALADQPPLCLATGAWNVGTDVFGPLAARPNDSPYEAIVDRIFELERNAQDDFGDYGWFLFGAGPHYSYQWDAATKRHYADPRRFEYHTYQRETQLWWCYLRSGERKFYDWCFPSENHWVDVAVSHVPLTYSTEWRGGTRGEATLHFPAGDWSIDSPLHYVRHHDTGEAWLRSASQFWGSYHRTLETTTLAYYLTGDERYNDVVEFWKDYWGALAGVRSDSKDAKPWHRDQMWFQATAAGAPAKLWAEMIRDYAPFQSGSRHQQTLFFNLSTLYEHTWNPTIKKVLDEYAAAFIRPENPNGVWQCQDHHLPANADSPLLAHYWAPALWKYARASGDPRMPEVLKKYFTACIEADPYGGDVGIYSNNQIAWAWHFTHDPRHLRAAAYQLEQLRPHAEPLAKPEDLGGRIYNPYAPIMCLATVPRLIAVLEDAKRRGIAIPPPGVLQPQRTLIAIERLPETELRGTLWGWDSFVSVHDATSRPCAITTKPHRSHRQPFDRATPGYQVFQSDISCPGQNNDGWLFVSPKLETGILELSGGGGVWCWAGEPVRFEPGRPWHWRRMADAVKLTLETTRPASLTLETARPASLQVAHDGRRLTGRVEKNRLIVSLSDLPPDATIAISGDGSASQWFRVIDTAAELRWVTLKPPTTQIPPTPTSLIEARRRKTPQVTDSFTAGRFGEALYVDDKRTFEVPDEAADADGVMRRLSNQQQGSIEFWVRRLADERTTNVPRITLLDAGSLTVALPANVPLDEWCHVAVDWFPLPGDATKSLVCTYVDGVDYGNYRSMYWEGYSVRPTIFNADKPWTKQFVIKAIAGAPFMIDDLRISTRPRHVDTTLPFGRAQTFNPNRLTPPPQPAKFDNDTAILLKFDGDLSGTATGGRTIVVGTKP